MTDYFKSRERNILFRRIEALSPEMQSVDKKINGHQTICHLNDSLRTLFTETSRQQGVAALLNRTVGKWLVFHLLPWRERMPKNGEEMLQFMGNAPQASFADDHATFILLLQEFDTRCNAGTMPRHSRFGMLSRHEWGQYLYLHIDYHLSVFNIHGDYRASK